MGPLAPLSGGALILDESGWLIIAEPDLDQLYVVDSHDGALEHTVDLDDGDEPWRMAVDERGRAHVVLRGAGELATIQVSTGEVLARRAVCLEPRGVAYQRAGTRVHVACAGGTLVSLPAAGGAAVRTVHLDRDLRDVAVDGDDIYVSRLRTAEVLVVDGTGTLVNRTGPGRYELDGEQFAPAVAWRMKRASAGGVWVLHQRVKNAALAAPPPRTRSGYGPPPAGACSAPVAHTALTRVRRDGPGRFSPPLWGMSLPVDFSISPVTRRISIVNAAGTGEEMVRLVDLDDHRLLSGDEAPVPCPELEPMERLPTARAVAVTHVGNRRVVHFRGHLMLSRDRWVELPSARADAGFTLFHQGTPSGFACATCHPDGGDDGHVWNLPVVGMRRTQASWGGIGETLPLHWDGSAPDMHAIMVGGFVGLMRGDLPSASDIETFSRWIDTIPAPQSVPRDLDAVERGYAAFDTAGCSDCHAGSHFTDDTNHDLGSGTAFQTPTLLGVSHRPPYFHDGCAPTLESALTGECGGPTHHVPAVAADVVAYLETL